MTAIILKSFTFSPKKQVAEGMSTKLANPLGQLSIAAVVLALLLSIAAIAQLTYNSYQSFLHKPQHSTPIATTPVKQSAYSVQTILNSQLFGMTKARNVEQMSLPKTSASLQLRGAFTASNPQAASAIIEASDGQAKHYKVGDQVQGGLKLYAVYGDRIVLSNRGKLETLYFPSIEQRALPGATPPVTQTTKANIPVQPGKAIDTSSMSQAQRQALIRQRLEQLRNRNRQK
jgi:type II secretory pathway component PulC